MLRALLLLSISNLLSHKTRMLVSGAGICFAIFLMLFQWGILTAAKKETTLLYDYFKFDLAIISDKYQLLYSPDKFDRIRLIQALALDTVKDSFSLNIETSRWTDTVSSVRSSLLVIGIDTKPDFIADEGIRNSLDDMIGNRAVLADMFSHEDYGSLDIGTIAEVNSQEVDIVGHYQLGLFFYADGSVITRNDVFYKLTKSHSRDANIGLIQLKDGMDPALEKLKLKAVLPKDIIILTKEELIAQEQSYFVKVKPLGVMFKAGMLIAFFTGVVILFQIMSTDVGNRIKEYATIKAIGFSSLFVYAVAIIQIVILSAGAFIPAVFISGLFFKAIYSLTNLPVEITPDLLMMVFSLTVMMGLTAGVFSLYKLSQAHPAELF